MISVVNWRGEMIPLTGDFVRSFFHMKEGAIAWGMTLPEFTPLIHTMLDLMRAGF